MLATFNSWSNNEAVALSHQYHQNYVCRLSSRPQNTGPNAKAISVNYYNIIILIHHKTKQYRKIYTYKTPRRTNSHLLSRGRSKSSTNTASDRLSIVVIVTNRVQVQSIQRLSSRSVLAELNAVHARVKVIIIYSIIVINIVPPTQYSRARKVNIVTRRHKLLFVSWSLCVGGRTLWVRRGGLWRAPSRNAAAAAASSQLEVVNGRSCRSVPHHW